jgi:hypothetical protein
LSAFDHSTSLHVPSIDLAVAGDVVYNQCHMYVGDTTPESRTNWAAALDRLAAPKPATVVAGHKKPGVPDSPSAIEDTKRYLLDFDRMQKTAASDAEIFNQMTGLVRHWAANQPWLMFGLFDVSLTHDGGQHDSDRAEGGPMNEEHNLTQTRRESAGNPNQLSHAGLLGVITGERLPLWSRHEVCVSMSLHTSVRLTTPGLRISCAVSESCMVI